MNSGSSDTAAAIFSLGKGNQVAEVKTLNAKKLDVNFDSDDFFTSF
jgi:hypothetical protein